MIKTVLLGDSIRLIGYGKYVAEYLGEGYSVWQPEDNCRFAQYTLRMLFEYSNEINSADIVHFNVGLWDTCDLFGDGPFTPEDEYVETVSRIADLLLKNCKKVIFATTTPIVPGNLHHTNERIQSYNTAAAKQLVKKGVIINDLYSLLCGDIEGNIRSDDRLHLTEKAEIICAKNTAKIISEAVREIGNQVI